MKINLNETWQTIMASEFQKSYFSELMKSVEEEYNNNICFPPKELIFSALNNCSFEDTKVVIIGQDPYHGKGEANGLCFSLSDGKKTTPSLNNIFKEIENDLGKQSSRDSNFIRWAKQGVLLLNSSLTVRENIADSHKGLKWNLFTDAVIQKISEEKQNVVFILWGNPAKKKINKINNKDRHLILESGHPSYAHVHKKWFGNRHFSQANDYLQKNNLKAIEWL